MADDKGKNTGRGRSRADRDDAAPAQPDQDVQPRAVQVGQGEHGQAAGDALAAFAHGDQPTSQRTAEQVEDLTAVSADDEERHAQGRQVGAAEGLAAAEAGNAQVQALADAENVAGYRGINPDPTPNVAYTSEGRALNMATPETDQDAFETAQRALRAGGGRFPVTEAGQRQHQAAQEAQQRVADQTRQNNDQARQNAQQ